MSVRETPTDALVDAKTQLVHINVPVLVDLRLDRTNIGVKVSYLFYDFIFAPPPSILYYFQDMTNSFFHFVGLC